MISDDSDVEYEDILENDNQEFIPEKSVDYDETKKSCKVFLISCQMSKDCAFLCIIMMNYL